MVVIRGHLVKETYDKEKKYSKEFKEKLVLKILSNQSSPTQMSRREGIAPVTLRAWQDDFAKGGFQTKDHNEAVLRQRVAQLKSAVGELALEKHILPVSVGEKSSKIAARISAKRAVIKLYLAPEFGIRRSCKAMGKLLEEKDHVIADHVLKKQNAGIKVP